MSARCLTYLLCLNPCCVSFVCLHNTSPTRTDMIAFFFIIIIIIIIIVTLYSRTTPFCSSCGGGCQETMMAVPLSPLSVTVTSRGGALGTDGNRQKSHFKYDFSYRLYPPLSPLMLICDADIKKKKLKKPSQIINLDICMSVSFSRLKENG